MDRQAGAVPLLFLLLIMFTPAASAGLVDDIANGAGWVAETVTETYDGYEEYCQTGDLTYNKLLVGCATPIVLDVVEGTDDAVQNDVYAGALTVNDTREQVLLQRRSSLNQSYGIALAKAKLTAVEALNNGTSLSDAKTQALDDVQQFYTARQRAILSHRTREVLRWNETLHTVEATDNLYVNGITEVELDPSNDGDLLNPQVTRSNLSLFNGSEQEVLGFRWRDEMEDSSGSYYELNATYPVYPIDPSRNVFKDWTGASSGSDPSLDDNVSVGALKVLDTTGNRTTFLYHPPYRRTYEQLQDSYSRAEDNVLDLVNKLYQEYDPGQLTAPDALGPLEATITASTNYQDTGYYSYLALSFAQMGLAYNASYAFKVEWWNGSTKNGPKAGQLFVPKDFNSGTLSVGETYDASGRSVWFVHATDDGAAVETPLKGNFTITSMTDKATGEKINSTSVQPTRFYTDDTQDLQNQLDALHSRVDSLAGEIPTVGGITDQLIDQLLGYIPLIETPQQLVIAALAVLALLFYLAFQAGGGGLL